MKLLVLSKYGRKGASSRLRFMQYLPALKAAGIDAQVSSLLDDDYLQAIYSGVSGSQYALRGYFRRLRDLLGTFVPDVIWLEKEAFPFAPHWLETRLLSRKVPVVSDFDDAVFHNYDLHRYGLVRRLLGDKIDRVMASSALVMAGNAYLAQRARQAGAASVEIVPTVVDASAYNVFPRSETERRARIGWVGTPSTWRRYMVPMLPMLTSLARQHGAVIRNVGGATSEAPHPYLEVLPWSEDREVQFIQEMDIGLMPLDDSPWSRGKCGFKLIQYMACGLPVVASPVGVNAEIVEHGVNGFLATTEEEWREAISRLLGDPSLRLHMGATGRQKVEQQFSLQVWAPRVARLLKSVVEGGRR